MQEKYRIIPLGDYPRDPNVYHKRDYSPFGQESMTWRVFYMKITNRRGKVRVFASYGRSYQEALDGLRVATKKRGFTRITKSEYYRHGGEVDE